MSVCEAHIVHDVFKSFEGVLAQPCHVQHKEHGMCCCSNVTISWGLSKTMQHSKDKDLAELAGVLARTAAALITGGHSAQALGAVTEAFIM
jgi:hypothetical protein